MSEEGLRKTIAGQARKLEGQAYAIRRLTEEIERLRQANGELVQGVSKCPFDHAGYELPLDTPCPVCGGLGHHDSPNLCPYPSTNLRGNYNSA